MHIARFLSAVLVFSLLPATAHAIEINNVGSIPLPTWCGCHVAGAPAADEKELIDPFRFRLDLQNLEAETRIVQEQLRLVQHRRDVFEGIESAAFDRTREDLRLAQFVIQEQLNELQRTRTYMLRQYRRQRCNRLCAPPADIQPAESTYDHRPAPSSEPTDRVASFR